MAKLAVSRTADAFASRLPAGSQHNWYRGVQRKARQPLICSMLIAYSLLNGADERGALLMRTHHRTMSQCYYSSPENIGAEAAHQIAARSIARINKSPAHRSSRWYACVCVRGLLLKPWP